MINTRLKKLDRLVVPIWKRYGSFQKNVTSTNVLKRPNFDYKGIIEDQTDYIESILRRELNPQLVDDCRDIKSLYAKFVDQDVTLRNLKNERNILNDEIKKIKSLKDLSSKDREKEILSKLAESKNIVKILESEIDLVRDDLFLKAESLPNLLDSSVDDKEDIISYINPIQDVEFFDLKENSKFDHKEIAERLGIVDFKIASKVCGNSWYYLIGDGALLEQALVQYALKLARHEGFKMVIPPSIVKTEITNSCGFKPRDQSNEQQVYELTNDGLCLTGTAEISLAGLHINKVFENPEALPSRLVGVSRSYRAEAGARGKDTKGLYRVHEFTKVELFSFTKANIKHSLAELEKLLNFQKKFIESLGLTAKIINMPANDLGAPAYKKYDIECFMPGRGNWGELSSASNCTDYQSRRLNIKYRDTSDGMKLKYVHTLNGTAVAVPRVIVAIIENFYDPETESIIIPKVLREYMDGKDKIVKQ
ncbi:hypothetical protein PACTADRAFT_49207 [Pachysolen tannophilus NRRL Y-2460]|uniref:serine--tRNA ligase n=1 Tax=Pachysolen tannophilus NRRL Y-2460 TaxID=669874 RepID=A0A1E4TVI4_PACTA|nr:hypothetical protein PACTADRAFT_49207 [Pachysolen tannophilus NRRL Y-2460]